MGAAFDGKLNLNSRRKDDAMSGGSDPHSYGVEFEAIKRVCRCSISIVKCEKFCKIDRSPQSKNVNF